MRSVFTHTLHFGAGVETSQEGNPPCWKSCSILANGNFNMLIINVVSEEQGRWTRKWSSAMCPAWLWPVSLLAGGEVILMKGSCLFWLEIKGSGLWNSSKPPRERRQAEKGAACLPENHLVHRNLFHVSHHFCWVFFLFFFADVVGILSLLLCGFWCGRTNVSEPAPASVPGKPLHQEGLQGRERAEEAAAKTHNTAEIPIKHPPEGDFLSFGFINENFEKKRVKWKKQLLLLKLWEERIQLLCHFFTSQWCSHGNKMRWGAASFSKVRSLLNFNKSTKIKLWINSSWMIDNLT